MLRTQLYANPENQLVHDLVLESCRRAPQKTAIVDAGCNRRISYEEYGELVEAVARGFIAAGVQAGDVIAIFLPNSWEFCVAYHAATLARAIPTPLNPTYREREVRYQLENSGAVMLIADGPNLVGIHLHGLPRLRKVYTTRHPSAGAQSFQSLITASRVLLPPADQSTDRTLAALPYSSGTTGLPKGVMLSHFNLVANIFQLLGPRGAPLSANDNILCFLPLYHIYGLNVIANPALVVGATLVLVPRFHSQQVAQLLVQENITMMPVVPPALNALCQLAEAGQFPPQHRLVWVKCGAAPLAPELAYRFTTLTGIAVCQGYGMTEASPVTHLGYLDADLYRPDSIGQPLALTQCRVLDQTDAEAAAGLSGELVMCGPQFMQGYWYATEATAAVLRDGWYWSGDIVTRDKQGFFRVVDRLKEMIKYKGFSIAPAEVEAVLMEHPAVRDCGVVGAADGAAGEIPVAFVVLRDGLSSSGTLQDELCAFVADRLTHYKQPRQVRFVTALPRTPSGKILRRELRKM